MTKTNRIRAGLAVAALLLMSVAAQHHDAASHEAEARIAESRAEMAGRGPCGRGGELARMHEGYACLFTKPDGTMLATPAPLGPVQVARGR